MHTIKSCAIYGALGWICFGILPGCTGTLGPAAPVHNRTSPAGDRGRVPAGDGADAPQGDQHSAGDGTHGSSDGDQDTVVGGDTQRPACTDCAQIEFEPGVDLNGFNSDRYTWSDASSQQRSAAFVHTDAPDPAGQWGGYLREYTYVLDGSDAGGGTRTCTGASSAHPGFGHIVNHFSGRSDSSRRYQGTSSGPVFLGQHHALHQYTWYYPIDGHNVTITVQWLLSTGRNHPLWAVTLDTSEAPANAVSADTRAPYGAIGWDGNTDSEVDGAEWGDRYKFRSLGSPLTLSNGWDYSEPNTVPYAGVYSTSTDSEMGLVQTQTYLQHDAGGYWNYTNWGATDPDGPMPNDWNWTYQLNQYEIPFTTRSKRLAWGSNYGAVGETAYNVYGDDGTAVGYPYQSYSIHVVFGQRSYGAVARQVLQVEAVQQTELVMHTGQRIDEGPAGLARPDTVTYAPLGFNHVYGSWEVKAVGGEVAFDLVTSASSLQQPLLIVHDWGTSPAPETLRIGGETAVADTDYFASVDPAQGRLWITFAGHFTGTTSFSIGE